MGDGWLGLIGVIVGAGRTSVAEAIRSRRAFKRERWWLLYEEHRRRFEEIYIAVEEHRQAYRDTCLDAVSSLEGGTAEMQLSSKVPWAKLRMLVHLNAPELLSHLAAIEQAGKEFR